MFTCGVKRWKHKRCRSHQLQTCGLHGNQSMDSSKDDEKVSPTKKQKLSGDKTGFLKHQNNYDIDDKENWEDAKKTVVMMIEDDTATLISSDIQPDSKVDHVYDNVSSQQDSGYQSLQQISHHDNYSWLSQGQLDISIQVDTSHKAITIQVYGIQNMKMAHQGNIYVETKLVNGKHYSKVQSLDWATKNGNAGSGQSATYNLKSEDEEKRLMISVNHKESNNNKSLKSDMLGCMSFGIKRLFSRNKSKPAPVDGWFHILPENVGRHKHHRVSSGANIQDSAQSGGKLPTVKSVAKQLSGENLKEGVKKCKTFNITVPRAPEGYGFTLAATTPVRIGRITPDGAADRHGVRRGDIVLSINNSTTTDVSVHTLARIVKASSVQINLSIARRRKTGKTRGTKSASEKSISNKSSHLSSEHISTCGVDLTKDVLNNNILETPSLWQPDISLISEEKPMDIMYSKDSKQVSPSLKWDPYISNISQVNDVERFMDDASFVESSENTYEEIQSSHDYVGVLYPQQTPLHSKSLNSTSASLEITENTNLYQSLLSRKPSPDCSCCNGLCMLDESAYGSGNLFSSEVEQQRSIDQFLALEKDFSSVMKSGIERFSRPLRHHILSASQHRLLFRNMEKLAALSEYYISQLSVSARDATKDVQQIYSNKQKMMCDAHKLYRDGHSKALLLLKSLEEDPKFYKFIRKLEKQHGFPMSLAEFLSHPLDHFQQLTACLESIFGQTSCQDHCNFRQLACDALSTKYSKRSDKPSCSSSLESRLSAKGHNTSRVDKEMTKLKNKLTFAPDVKPFDVTSNKRHVVFASDLVSVTESTSDPCWAVLCNDLILLTRKTAQGQLKVTRNPVMLSQVIEADFECEHPCELALLVQSSSQDITEQRLRARDLQQKSAWKSLLHQRITHCKSQTDSAIGSMEESI